jgi:hypothetical protein
MGGSPLVSLLIILLLLAGVSYPLVWLEKQAARPVELQALAQDSRPCEARARFSLAPASAKWLAAGAEVAAWEPADGLDWQETLNLPFFENMTEPQLVVSWPAGSPEAAVQVFLAPDELEEKTATFWAAESLDETLHFQWTANQPNKP